MMTCHLCPPGDNRIFGDVTEHIRLCHPAEYEPMECWPDGQPVVVDQTSTPADFKPSGTSREYHDENTLIKVHEALANALLSHSPPTPGDLINEMLNAGILFRERRSDKQPPQVATMDWGRDEDEPDIGLLNQLVETVSGGQVHIYRPDVGAERPDRRAAVISDVVLTPEEATATYLKWVGR